MAYTQGHYWELGVESVPALRQIWGEIGTEIVAAANKNKQR